MKRLTKLPIATATASALAGCLLLSSASADRHPAGLYPAIDQIERSTDALFLDFKDELKHRGLWKPRGIYSTIYSATFRMEEYGDSLRKYAKRGSGLSSLARVASKIDHQVHLAADAARQCRFSRQFHANLARVSRATHQLVQVCQPPRGSGYLRERESFRPDPQDYRSRAPRYRGTIERGRTPRLIDPIRRGAGHRGATRPITRRFGFTLGF